MKLWLAGELAERYGVYRSTVQNWCRNGTLPNAYLETRGNRNYWLVPESDLENFTPGKKGSVRKQHPAPLTIVKRAQRARANIKQSHGYGKTEILEMLELQKNGIKVVEIACRFGIEEQTLEDILRQAAIKPPKQKKPPSPKRKPVRLPKDMLRRLYEEEQLPTPEMLRILKTNYASLYINLRHYGIPLRTINGRIIKAEREKQLRQLFLEEHLTPEVIAERLNLTAAYVKRKLTELKINKKSD